MTNMHYTLLQIFQKVVQLTSEADRFLIEQPDIYEDLKQILHQFHRLVLEDESEAKQVLPELFIDGLDEEQIWQQIEMYNKFIAPKFLKLSSRILTLQPEQLKFCLDDDTKGCVLLKQSIAETEIPASNPINAAIDENEEFNDEDDDDGSTEDIHLESKSNAKSNSKTIVDDEFFKLDEMEEFLKIEENKELNRKEGKLLDDDGYIDFFAENLGCENSKMDESLDNVAYKDFFRSDGGENYQDNDKYHDDLEELNTEEESQDSRTSYNDCSNFGDQSDQLECASMKENGKQMSSYELRLMRLNRLKEEYEEEVLGEKHWTFKGEVNAKSRPQNAILEEFLDFDSTIRPAPLITEKTTQCLEHIIRKRIKDKSWDDVQRKVRPMNKPLEYRKELILQQEKSKESLVTIYEREYQNQLQNLDKNQNSEILEHKEENQKIKNLMHNLFIKLNALTNFHFTPKPVASETKIITNTPAIHMEEVAPVGVSDVKLLAPTEVFKSPKGELLGKSELTKSMKKHALRVKKLKQSSIHKDLKDRDLPTRKNDRKSNNIDRKSQLISNRIVQKMNTTQWEGSIKSSKLLFTKLQNERNGVSNSKLKADKHNNSKLVKRLKL